MYQKNIKRKIENINEKATKKKYANLKAHICNIIMIISFVMIVSPLLVFYDIK